MTLNRFKFWINNKVIQWPSLADAVYLVAYRVNWLVSLARDNWAKVFPVRQKDLETVRSVNLVVGTTNICNARCAFCAYPRAVDNGTLRTGVMTMPTFRKVVTEWVSSGGNSMDLTPVVGDPLIDPGLMEKIRTAREIGISNICFTTNGILLNHHENYKQVVDLKVTTVYISIGATDEVHYREIYGVNQYPKVISGLRNFLEYNRQMGEPVYINFRFRNSQRPSEILRSADFVTHIRPFLSRKVEVNFTVDFDNWGGVIRQEELPGHMRLRKARPEVNLPCVSLFGFSIRHDGSVRLCGCRMQSSDLDDLVVGNVNQQTLEEIRTSARTQKIIDGFYHGDRPETCKLCTLYTPITRNWLKQIRPSAPIPLANKPEEVSSTKSDASVVNRST